MILTEKVREDIKKVVQATLTDRYVAHVPINDAASFFGIQGETVFFSEGEGVGETILHGVAFTDKGIWGGDKSKHTFVAYEDLLDIRSVTINTALFKSNFLLVNDEIKLLTPFYRSDFLEMYRDVILNINLVLNINEVTQ